MSNKENVVIVTGSSNGIGREIALEFAINGSKVIVNGRNKDAIDKILCEIKSFSGEAIGVVADLKIRSQVEKLVNESLNQYGRIDVIVNNAGDTSGSSKTLEINDEEWDKIIDGNLNKLGQ